MQGKLEGEGKYELFETTKGHQILNLDDKNFFAVVKGKYGDILVRSDSDHEKKKTVKKGKYFHADFDDDPEFRDLPHLFLQEGSKFREWILPNDAPTDKDYQKKLVKADNLVDKATVEYHVKGSGKKGTEKKYKGTAKEAKPKEEGTGKNRPAAKSGNLQRLSKSELYEKAKKKNIGGRSKMSKDDLVKALH